jgi:hypothetical protein
MLKRIVLGCMMILVCLPVSNPARAQQKSPSPIRILVEGDKATSIIEALRKANTKYDIKLEFAAGPDHPYDLRLLVRRWSEIREVGNFSPDEDNSNDTEYIFYASANAQTADGKLLFDVKGERASSFPLSIYRKVYEDVAKGVIKNIYRHYESIRKESITSGRVSPETINQIAPEEAVKASAEEPPKEPGVYYKDRNDWILLAESQAKRKLGGIATAILTIGLFSIRSYDVYRGASAKVQIPERRPQFYVRGFPVAEEDIAFIRLKKDKDRREVLSKTTSIRGSSGHKTGVTHGVNATRISDVVYKLVPEAELPSGEYVLDLFLSDSVTGTFEFGVTPSE